jgi:hypothetical protein
MSVVGPYVITLQEARTHLRIPSNSYSEDDMLQNTFIPAVSDVIRGECGDIVPMTYDEYYDGGDFSIWLKHVPVLEVQQVEEGWGWTNYDLDYVQVNSTSATSMFAYSLDQPNVGQISRRSGGNVNIKFMHGSGNIHVTYVAGRSSVPGAVRLAALLLLEFWYQGSEQRGSQYESTGYNAMDVAEPTSGAQGGLVGINIGIPYKVLELLRPYRHMPFIG